MSIHTIEGWFDFPAFYDRMVAECPDGSTVAEIGCYLGKSTCYLADAIRRSGKNIEVIAVDLWPDQSPSADFDFAPGMYEKFLHNVRANGLEGIIRSVIRGDSAEAAKQVKDGSLFMAFLDASHLYPAVKKDIPAWLPKVKNGGYLCGHDYASPHEGVIRAVNEAFGRSITTDGSVWIYRKEARIPKKIHQVWVGGPMPDKYRPYVDGIRALHPNWEYCLWTDKNIGELGFSLKHEYPHPAQFSEAIRLKCVLDHGGIYLDADIEARKPMDSFLQYDAFTAMAKENDPEDRVCDAVFGAVKAHPWLQWQWDRVPQWRQYRHPFGVWLMSAAPRDIVSFIPVHLVYPFDWDTPEAERKVHPDSVLVHHWDKTWIAK